MIPKVVKAKSRCKDRNGGMSPPLPQHAEPTRAGGDTAEQEGLLRVSAVHPCFLDVNERSRTTIAISLRPARNRNATVYEFISLYFAAIGNRCRKGEEDLRLGEGGSPRWAGDEKGWASGMYRPGAW